MGCRSPLALLVLAAVLHPAPATATQQQDLVPFVALARKAQSCGGLSYEHGLFVSLAFETQPLPFIYKELAPVSKVLDDDYARDFKDWDCPRLKGAVERAAASYAAYRLAARLGAGLGQGFTIEIKPSEKLSEFPEAAEILVSDMKLQQERVRAAPGFERGFLGPTDQRSRAEKLDRPRTDETLALEDRLDFGGVPGKPYSSPVDDFLVRVMREKVEDRGFGLKLPASPEIHQDPAVRRIAARILAARIEASGVQVPEDAAAPVEVSLRAADAELFYWQACSKEMRRAIVSLPDCPDDKLGQAVRYAASAINEQPALFFSVGLIPGVGMIATMSGAADADEQLNPHWTEKQRLEHQQVVLALFIADGVATAIPLAASGEKVAVRGAAIIDRAGKQAVRFGKVSREAIVASERGGTVAGTQAFESAGTVTRGLEAGDAAEEAIRLARSADLPGPKTLKYGEVPSPKPVEAKPAAGADPGHTAASGSVEEINRLKGQWEYYRVDPQGRVTRSINGSVDMPNGWVLGRRSKTTGAIELDGSPKFSTRAEVEARIRAMSGGQNPPAQTPGGTVPKKAPAKGEPKLWVIADEVDDAALKPATTLGSVPERAAFKSPVLNQAAADGRLVVPAGRTLSPAEEAVAEILINEGKKVEGVVEGTTRTSDFLVDGVRTEVKTVTEVTSKDPSGRISSRIMDGAGQAPNIIVDARGHSVITQDIAERGIRRAYGADKVKRVQTIRILGDGFDITVPRKP